MAEIRHIVLIVIDCLRADHVSAYGYQRATTPILDALAGEGVLWENAVSASSWTRPSITSLLTGLYPSQHGALEGVKRSRGKFSVPGVLNGSVETLAQRLSARGWSCGAFLNNHQLDPFSGLDRGFAVYRPAIGKADLILAGYRDWFRRSVPTPTFTYLHFLESHWPYKPRRRHVAEFGGDRDTNYFRGFSGRDFGRLRQAIEAGEQTLTSEQIEQMVQMYDGAVRRLDGKIEAVLELLRDAGAEQETAVFVTADHGEEFLDHGLIGHGHSLYDELVHVPLVARIPGGPAGERRGVPVSHVDLFAALLEITGIDSDARPSGRGLLRDDTAAEPVFSELRIQHRYWQAIRAADWKLHRRLRFDRSDARYDPGRSVADLRAVCPHRVAVELYNLCSDPHERNDLSRNPANADRCSALLHRLDGWWDQIQATADRSPTVEIELDPLVAKQLQALGYLE